jgi:hypothetical protein
MTFACLSRPATFVLLLAACSPAPKGDSTDTATDSTTDPGSDSEGMSTTGSASTEAGTTTEPTTGTTGTTGTTTDATTGTTGTTTGTTGTTADGSTTDGLVCDLVEITTERAHALGGDVLDCGIVDPWNNTVAEWQTAHACALDAAAAQKQFQLVVWLQGIDSSVGRGYVGTAARSYALEEIHFDTLGFPITAGRPCAGFTAVDGCTDFLGTPCLNCEEPGPGATLCDSP